MAGRAWGFSGFGRTRIFKNLHGWLSEAGGSPPVQTHPPKVIGLVGDGWQVGAKLCRATHAIPVKLDSACCSSRGSADHVG